ncbi:Peroxisomal membrane 22 kDa family protein isoform 1 [Tripterygium wilfordii]|uniref:Peroxisomal membrane 22 kDa family protein isoform 1 n=1 Tax=Tripterygium wilfordii TaxID=458696 RepID=A0A7J7CZE7_TRIWF|nr:PXMP2/4 family protein 4-like [Tripterygium wilfordii]KAF5739464.1 Peroxisomal membrane 22 kDa family protein isoform 1 [Tripterygium wilfordii]
MCTNSIVNISKRCHRRLTETRFSCDAIASAEPFIVNKQQWRSITNSASTTKYPKFYPPSHSHTFSTASSPPPRKGFLGWYLSKLDSHPLVTKSVTSSIIYAAADFTSQKMIASPSSYDLIRTLRMAGFGLLILGPSQHQWFNFLSKFLPKRDAGTTLKKILMGQTIFGPVINSIFFSYSAVLQGESGGEIVARLKRDLLPTLINGVLYWPTCDFITFKFVPVHLQPLVNSLFAYIWTIYLTHMANLKKVGKD